MIAISFIDPTVNQETDSAIINQRNQLQCGAGQLCLLVYKPHEYYSSLGIINYSNWSFCKCNDCWGCGRDISIVNGFINQQYSR